MKRFLCKNVMMDDIARKAFDTLINQTFGLSFEEWYQKGEWGEWNQPYTLIDGERAIANITVNHMKALYDGKVRNYIQIGGVATDPEHRGKGLSRQIMEEVLKDWADKCDAIFLLGNHSVAEFYPKFGFAEEKQYIYTWNCDKVNNVGDRGIDGIKSDENARNSDDKTCDKHVRKLDLSNAEDYALLYRCYEKQNPFSAFQFVDNASLLKFYCHYGMDEAMYYIEEEDAVIVAEQEENKLCCYDIYYDGKLCMKELLSFLLTEEIEQVELRFTPKDRDGLTEELFQDEDTHLFVFDKGENIFTGEKLYVPELSHT